MIGSSYEGRELTFAKVSSNPNASNPIILIDGGIHAREWIAPSTVLYILQQLVESEANKDLLDGIDWYLLPVLNPDGYAFSHSDVRNSLITTASSLLIVNGFRLVFGQRRAPFIMFATVLMVTGTLTISGKQ